VDLTKNFYFSYTYDITNTLQHNIVRTPPSNPLEGGAPAGGSPAGGEWCNEMFTWNHFLNHARVFADNMTPWAQMVPLTSRDWVIPIIHGYVSQTSELLCTLLFRERASAGLLFESVRSPSVCNSLGFSLSFFRAGCLRPSSVRHSHRAPVAALCGRAVP
jgi:hypothetical protein